MTTANNNYLDKDGLHELTGFWQKCKQREALKQMGVAFRERARDRFPLVPKSTDNKQVSAPTTPKPWQPPVLPLAQPKPQKRK